MEMGYGNGNSSPILRRSMVSFYFMEWLIDYDLIRRYGILEDSCSGGGMGWRVVTYLPSLCLGMGLCDFWDGIG